MQKRRGDIGFKRGMPEAEKIPFPVFLLMGRSIQTLVENIQQLGIEAQGLGQLNADSWIFFPEDPQDRGDVLFDVPCREKKIRKDEDVGRFCWMGKGFQGFGNGRSG
jgi:hypothetical protein